MVWKLNVHIYFLLGQILRLDIPKHQSCAILFLIFFFSFWQINFYSFQEPVENKTVKGGMRIAEL